MRLKPSNLFPLIISILLCFSSFSYAQNWAGILSSSRGVDWSKAGVEGGVPNRTTICTTLSSGASTATINSAISSCSSAHSSDAGGVVVLNAGTYSLTGILMKSNVTLRGAGADQTILNFTSHAACGAICFQAGDNTYPASTAAQPGGSNSASWTSGYSQGATQIVLTGLGSSGLSVGKFINLDQADTSSPTGNVVVCSNTSAPCSLEGPNGPRVIGGTNHGMDQIVKITACNPSCTSGATFTISPGLYGASWSSSNSPGAWWSSSPILKAGLEDVTVDDTNDSGGANNIGFYNAFNCWVSGVRSINPTRSHVQYGQSAHNTVMNNYFYGTKNAQSQSYGVESYLGSDNLTINNIAHRVSSPWMTQLTMGNVFLYNYDILDYYCSGGSSGCNDNANGTNTMGQTTWLHNSTVMFTLWEGNITPGYKGDVFHGSGGLQTAFRNQVLGWAPFVGTRGTNSFTLQSYNRAYNIIGNVLGKDGFTTSYQNGSGAKIFDLGSGNSEGSVTVPNDSGVASTLFRWANVDAVTGFTKPRYCGTSSNTNWAVCGNSSEVPSGIGSYANSIPGSEDIPASFYYSNAPGWWPANKPWPLLGPDVSNGNVGVCSGGTYAGNVVTASSQCGGGTKVAAFGGHSNSNPAMDCYFQMGGAPDGTSTILKFNADSCYGANAGTGGGGSNPTGPAPNPPTGLNATVS